jgi:hypothetical protein
LNTSNAGLETYPYSPRLVRVTSLYYPLLGSKSPASSVICRLRSQPRSLRLVPTVAVYLQLRRLPLLHDQLGSDATSRPRGDLAPIHSSAPVGNISAPTSPAFPISCACHGGRLVHRCEAATNGTAEPRDGRSPSGGVPERTLQLRRPSATPKHPVPQAEKLEQHDAAGCRSSAGQRQPTAPAAPHQHRQGQVASRRTCQPACRLVGVGLRGLGRQAGLRQHCPPLPHPVHLRIDSRRQRKVMCRSSTRKLQWQPSRQSS